MIWSRPRPIGFAKRFPFLPCSILAAFVVAGACQAPERPEDGDRSVADGLAATASPAVQIVESAIARHGGRLFERSRIRFTFRGVRFEVERDNGRFRYARSYADPLGRSVVEVMDNDGTRKEVDGEGVLLDPDERAAVELAVNSVVYFGFLPFRLRDPAVRLRSLGTAEVNGEPYEKVEVTFHPDGGGVDWEDRFVHWIHASEYTLDYLAHAYHREGGGIRFRRAVNRREVGGLLVQDYENYRPVGEVSDIADLDRRFEAGALELLSLIELEEVEVTLIDPGRDEGPGDGTPEGLREGRYRPEHR